MTKRQEADAEKAHQTEKRSTADAIRETDRLERDAHRNQRPARPDWRLPWDRNRTRP